MNRIEANRLLRNLHACSESIDWLETIFFLSPKRTWEACDRADWLLWFAAQAEVEDSLLVLAACACARPALVHVPAGETRPLRAIDTAEAWARGEATIEQVKEANLDTLDLLNEYIKEISFYTAAAAANNVVALTLSLATKERSGCEEYLAAADHAAATAMAAAMNGHGKSLADLAVIVRTHIPWDTVHAKLTDPNRPIRLRR